MLRLYSRHCYQRDFPPRFLPAGFVDKAVSSVVLVLWIQQEIAAFQEDARKLQADYLAARKLTRPVDESR